MKIKTISQKLDFSHIYEDRIKSITKNIKENLDLWKGLELKYKLSQKKKNTKSIKQDYIKKAKLYNLEIQKSLSALMIISVNIKNLI